MKDLRNKPDYIFESSWEVCNKVGGIYTVLSTRAKTMKELFGDNVIFIGPDVWKERENPLFREDKRLMRTWRADAEKEGLQVRVGRWQVPGNPCAILVDFTPYYAMKNKIYTDAWNDFGVDSLHAYGDYDEASMFSYAAALVAESYYRHSIQKGAKVVYHAHEWMTCLGALYIRQHVPEMATIFTTHATSIGRSIAGNDKPLYEYLWAYNGCQMAEELNMQSKHSIERQCAHNVDCFTTVSEVTARECRELLDKDCDEILMNGFESDFVPRGASFASRRKKSRSRILQVANALTGVHFGEDTMIVSTGGRYEFKNKGIDVFLESLYRSLYDDTLKRPVIALVMVPAWMKEARQDLAERLKKDAAYVTPLAEPNHTHLLHDMQGDRVLGFLRSHGICNGNGNRVQVIFVPCYLDGNDGVFNLPYYDLLVGTDLAVYPSYYEPWGYTPLEATAFHVPCVTTSLSGFGLWANAVKGGKSTLEDGVEVIERNDYNFSDVANAICSAVSRFSAMSDSDVEEVRRKASTISQKALWKNFIVHYLNAYDKALGKAQSRLASE